MDRMTKELAAAGDTDAIPAWMTAREWVELRALAKTVADLGGKPSFLSVSHRKFYERLRRHGLVLWTFPHPTMGRRFAQVVPTDEAVELLGAFE
jgi:hypothetical protein